MLEKTHLGFSRIGVPLRFELKVEVQFLNFAAFTIPSKEYERYFGAPPLPSEFLRELPDFRAEENEYGYLIVDTFHDLERYDALNELSAKARPQLLVLFGVFSFLANHQFTPFEVTSATQFVMDGPVPRLKQCKFACKGRDLSKDMQKIIERIDSASDETRALIFSVFERWRKALYLEGNSEDNLVYSDEAILAYIHILEVLSDEFKSSAKKKVEKKRTELIEGLIDLAKSSELPGQKDMQKIVNRLSLTVVTLRDKITEMLRELALLNPKSEDIIRRFIKHRNDIAHGRKNIYEDRAIYPLPTFFSMVKDIDEKSETIKILSAVTISRFLGLSIWKLEWKIILSYEPTPLQSIREFIGGHIYETLSNDEFITAKHENLAPPTFHIISKGVT